MEERRKHKRVPIDTVLMCQLPKEDDLKTFGFHEISTPASVDISLGGMQFKAETSLPVGLHLVIYITIRETDKPLELEGKIVWVKKAEEGSGFRLGIEFADLADKRKKKMIQEFVDQAD